MSTTYRPPPPPQRKTCATCQKRVPVKAERCAHCRSRFVSPGSGMTTDAVRGFILLAMIAVAILGFVWSAIT